MVAYCSREDVMSATGINILDPYRIDNAIASAADSIEALCHRRFYPETGTRTIPVGDPPRHFDLGRNDLLAVTSILDGTTAITAYTLQPTDAPANGRPYVWVDLDTSPGEDELTIAGTFGFTQATEQLTQIVGNLTSGATTMTVYSGARMGTGEFYKIGDEWLRVTERSFTDSGVNLAAALTRDNTDRLITATGFSPGEVLLIGAEQMQVESVTPTAIIVQRAINGTPLAAHDIAADIYVYRGCTIERGLLGTTAAAHTDGAFLGRLAVPPKVRQLAIAYALDTLAQEGAGYARTAGSGENERQTTTPALGKLRDDVAIMFGRSARTRAV